MGTFVMSIAGLDPSSGAGLTADIKTFEANGVYGFGVCSALTVQTDDRFYSVEWLPPGKIIAQALPLLEKFPVDYCKLGIVENLTALQTVIHALRVQNPQLRIVLDPVLKASAGYELQAAAAFNTWKEVLREVYLLTPNYDEAKAITGLEDGEEAARQLALYAPVLLKGGHHPLHKGTDQLFTGGTVTRFAADVAGVTPKHGSGCVLSAAITAHLAKGETAEEACRKGKAYTLGFLKSNHSLLGQHVT